MIIYTMCVIISLYNGIIECIFTAVKSVNQTRGVRVEPIHQILYMLYILISITIIHTPTVIDFFISNERL